MTDRGWNPQDPSGVYPPMRTPPSTSTDVRIGPVEIDAPLAHEPPAVDLEPPIVEIGPSARERLATSAEPHIVSLDGGAPTPAPPAAPPHPDEVLVVETQTFSSFYRQSWQPVARGLALTLGDTDLAIEATDEAMARAYPRWATLQAYDNPAGWVYRVGLNWARSHHRRIARMIPFRHHDTAELGPVTDPAVAEALLRLPIGQRSVVVCRLLLDWSVDETAGALDISPGTVKSRLHRALQTLESTLSHLR